MGSPFASKVFTQHEFTFMLPTGNVYKGDRGNPTVETIATVVRFYIKKASANPLLVGSKLETTPTHKAYITAINGLGSVAIDLPVGSTGNGSNQVIKVIGATEESIAPLTKLWGKVYLVQISDRSLLSNQI